MSTLISNPLGAYGQNGTTTASATGEYKASAAITRGQTLKFVTTGTGEAAVVTVAPSTAASDSIAGVALRSAAINAVVVVVVRGPALALASTTAVLASVAFSANASGQITTCSAISGQKAVGWVLEATSGTTANALILVNVAPSLVSAT